MAEPKKKKIRVIDNTATPVDEIKVETQYCISAELRMQQIYAAIARGLPTISPGEITDEPVAIACFGPSLNSTLDELRKFPKIMSMSGSHDVLLKNGIVPTWHLECDPRPHKAGFLQHPHKDTEYLISSCCHADVFNAVLDHKVKIWHLYGNEEMDNMPFIYPHNHWVLTGGSNVGLRAMVLARFFGHRQLHVFGMDCSFESAGGNTHASFHPNSTKFRTKVTVGETDYITSAVFLQYSRQFFDEVAKLPDCKVILHGRGMLQHMALEKAKNPTALPTLPANMEAIIAMSSKTTISDEYLELNKKLHSDRPDYGASGAKRVEAVIKLRTALKFDTVLDYGCGKGLLAKNLPFPIWEYDPAIAGKDTAPRPADLVVCSDVLEHIEPELLRAVIGDLRRVSKKLLYVVVHTGPAQKKLADGPNAHLIQQPAEWWIATLSEAFKVEQDVSNSTPLEVHLCCEPLPDKILPTMRSVIAKSPGLPDSQVQIEGGTGIFANTLQRVTTVEHKGTTIQFMTPNETTLWRAKTLFTKEPITIDWINTFQPGEVFFDVGANVGGYTVWASKHRGVRIMAFEPEHKNFELLTYNINLNNCEAVAALRVAATDRVLQDQLYLSNDDLGGSCHSFGEAVDFMLKPREALSQPCQGVPIDLMIAEHNFPTPNHVKIDVDGFEHKVIAGMLETLKKPELKSLLIEVNMNLPQHVAMLTQLEELGWKYDVKQAEQSRRKNGSFEGCGEIVFTRAEPESEFKLIIAASPVEKHILHQIEQTTLHTDPYGYLYIKNFFPDELYQQLLNALPDDTEYMSLRVARGTDGYPQRFVCASQAKIWKDLEKTMRGGRIREALCKKFGVFGPKDEVLLIRDHPGYKIGPHTDTPAKVISALIYLPKNDVRRRYGTSIFVPKEEGFVNPEGKHFGFDGFRKVVTMKYMPNAAFIFAKTDNSFHGVEPFDGQGVRDIYLYDIRK